MGVGLGDLWEGGENLFAICMRKMAFTLRSIPRGGTIFRGSRWKGDEKGTKPSPRRTQRASRLQSPPRAPVSEVSIF